MAEWSRRSGARSCRELPAPLYLPRRKEGPAAAAEPFSPGFNRDPVKGARTGWLNAGRESEEWKLGREGRKKKERGVGEGGSNWEEKTVQSLHKPIVMPPLCAELSGLVCGREEEQLGLINHNGN